VVRVPGQLAIALITCCSGTRSRSAEFPPGSGQMNRRQGDHAVPDVGAQPQVEAAAAAVEITPWR
jgi:hypothetical protein